MSPHRRSDCSFSLEHRQKQQCNRAASERFPFTGGAWHLSSGIAWLVFSDSLLFPESRAVTNWNSLSWVFVIYRSVTFFQGTAWQWERQSLLATLDFVSSSPRSSCRSLQRLPSSVKGTEANRLLSRYFKFSKLTSKRFKSDFFETLYLLLFSIVRETPFVSFVFWLQTQFLSRSGALFSCSFSLIPSAGALCW